MVHSVALKRPVPPESVAKSILFLASENWSGSITGQVLNVDSGKQGKVMWMQKECWSQGSKRGIAETRGYEYSGKLSSCEYIRQLSAFTYHQPCMDFHFQEIEFSRRQVSYLYIYCVCTTFRTSTKSNCMLHWSEIYPCNASHTTQWNPTIRELFYADFLRTGLVYLTSVIQAMIIVIPTSTILLALPLLICHLKLLSYTLIHPIIKYFFFVISQFVVNLSHFIIVPFLKVIKSTLTAFARPQRSE